jgi:hypothetical protein
MNMDNEMKESVEDEVLASTNDEGENHERQKLDDETDASQPSEKGDSADREKLLADYEDLQKRYEGLRQKMAKQEVPEELKLEDLKDGLGDIEDSKDKEFAEKFIDLLGKAGASKERAEEFLKGLAEIYQAEDPKTIYKNELKKLGKDGEPLLRELRQFRDLVRKSGKWEDGDIQALENATQTADGVRLIAKVLHSADVLKSGDFSAYRTSSNGKTEITNAEKISMYDRAYALRKTNPQDGEAELARLGKLFSE